MSASNDTADRPSALMLYTLRVATANVPTSRATR